MTEKIKPCPFCGGQGSVYECEYEDSEETLSGFVVLCDECDARGAAGDSEAKAIEQWNTRTFSSEELYAFVKQFAHSKPHQYSAMKLIAQELVNSHDNCV